MLRTLKGFADIKKMEFLRKLHQNTQKVRKIKKVYGKKSKQKFKKSFCFRFLST